MKRALVIHSGAVGDCILSLRVVEAIRQAGTYRVTMLGRSAYAQLVSAADGVDALIDLDAGDFHTLFSTECNIPDTVIDALKPFSLAVNMLGTDGATATQLKRVGIHRVIEIDPRPRISWSGHITDQWLEDLRANGIHARPGPPVLSVDERGRTAALAALNKQVGLSQNPLVILHPGSGSRTKCWPLKHFLKLARSMRDRNWRTAFLLGPIERERFSGDALQKLREVAPVLPAQGLCDVAATLAAVDLFVGNDSGVSHLAAAVGTRVIAVFRPTDPVLWRPLGEHVRIAFSATDWPDVSEVLHLILDETNDPAKTTD